MKLIAVLLAALQLAALPPPALCAQTPPIPKHFFTHCLMAYPELALSPENPMAPHYDADCITPDEFRNFLAQAHANGYALVDAGSLYRVTDGRVEARSPSLPAGKKPLVLSFDDVVYDRRKSGLGMADRIALDERGELCAETDAPPVGGRITYDREFVPILERFIADHPDFTADGARGVICLTGYDGILGYRTDRLSAARESEIARAKPVIAELKRRGWKFACHGYGHYHMNARSLGQLRDDTQKWLNEVAPLVGPTELYAYPYGEWDKHPDSPKQKALEDAGFRFFFGVGAADYCRITPERGFVDRHPLDGVSLRKLGAYYRDVFDAESVYCR